MKSPLTTRLRKQTPIDKKAIPYMTANKLNFTYMKIEKASVNDCQILTEITKKSKAHWGYSEEQIKKWTPFLTISKEYILTNSVYILTQAEQILGYYSYFNNEDNSITLDNLFITPKYIRKGLGKLLMEDFINRMKNTNCKKIILHADPNSEGFYQKLGFQKIGKFQTSIKNRFMPIMEMNLFN
jgi:N-acetylglutamate synthase-like GNAT family acetyltransferase